MNSFNNRVKLSTFVFAPIRKNNPKHLCSETLFQTLFYTDNKRSKLVANTCTLINLPNEF